VDVAVATATPNVSPDPPSSATRVSHAVPARRGPRASPSVDCREPYIINAQGDKHFKAACLK
jgi:hypothetical protein